MSVTMLSECFSGEILTEVQGKKRVNFAMKSWVLIAFDKKIILL